MVEWEHILLSVLAAGGGGGTVAYFLFQHLGKSWLDSKFSKGIEAFKHQQDIKLRTLQLEFDSRLSGHRKIQDEEFKILPAAWKRLYMAYSTIESVIVPYQQYPDVKSMSKERLKLVLSGYNFSEVDITELLNSSNIESDFMKTVFRYRAAKARNRLWAFHVYAKINAILLPIEIKTLFEEFSNNLHQAITDKEIGEEYGDYKMQTGAWKTLQEKVKPLYSNIENSIYEKLHSHTKARPTGQQ